MVAERKGVDRLNLRISTPEGVPLPFYRRGSTSTHTKRWDLLVYLGYGLSKPTDDVGQQAHHNHNDFIGQFDLSCCFVQLSKK
ncbi:hypothetical protein QLH32_13935 [Acinetobacter corruptisaponis]|uniref:Uncharacterized protein n=1 Tax=Acinetobacter corruptisaponis TaxID=3045147 RepID=A0ABY8S0I6_9GAMM|nr:hypothetical protein [Acinetobacter sp. KCTC 92772]WHP05120.1 hypothetical protein QLH32_13935 [Acinetobacter sp. KCTC 92772]